MRSEVIEPLLGATGTLVAEHLQLNGVEAEDHLVLAADHRRRPGADRQTRLDGCSTSQRQPRRRRSERLVARGRGSRGAARRCAAAATSAPGKGRGSMMRWTSSIVGPRTSARGSRPVLREHDDALKALKREARQAASLPEKLAIQKQIKQIETAREQHLELPVEEFLSRARPLPPHDEMVIEDLGAEEGEAFVLAVGS